MPSVTIRMEVDPVSRKRSIVVSYESDADALPNEHEEEHRALVQKLVEGGLVSAEEAGLIQVERAAGREVPEGEPSAEVGARKGVEQKG